MKFLHRLNLALIAAFFCVVAFGQAVPTQNPTYIPTAILLPSTKSAPFDYTFITSGAGTASIRVTGTCTSLTAAPQVSNDGTNWTTVPIFPAAGGASITSITGTGFWKVSVAGYSQARVHVTALTASCTFAMAASPGSAPMPGSTGGFPSEVIVDPSGANAAAVKAASTAAAATDPALVVTQSPNGDPCQVPTITKSSAVINVGAAATTKIVDTSASTTIYVCSFVATLAGTTPTVQFKTGTHTTNDCDTGAANLSGAFAPTSGNSLQQGGSGTLMKSSAGGQVCATTVGTGSSFQGVLTYVQQ